MQLKLENRIANLSGKRSCYEDKYTCLERLLVILAPCGYHHISRNWRPATRQLAPR